MYFKQQRTIISLVYGAIQWAAQGLWQPRFWGPHQFSYFIFSAGVSVHLSWSQEAVTIRHVSTYSCLKYTAPADTLQYRTGASTAPCSDKGLISRVFVFNLTPSVRFCLVWMCPVMLLHLYSVHFEHHWKRPA